jgi:hypothetical protein
MVERLTAMAGEAMSRSRPAGALLHDVELSIERARLWWLVTYDPSTETASRAIAVVGATRADRAIAWIGGPSATSVLDHAPGTPEAVRPDAVVHPAGDATLALVPVEAPPAGGLHDVVEALAAAATEVAWERAAS